MPWLTLSDSMHNDPRVVSVGNAAYGLYERLRGYCGQFGTNGFVTSAQVDMYGSRKDLAALLRASLIIEVAEGQVISVNRRRKLSGGKRPDFDFVAPEGGYFLPDLLLIDPTAEEHQDLRKKRRDAAHEKWRRDASASPNADADADAPVMPVPVPVPGAQDGSPPGSSDEGAQEAAGTGTTHVGDLDHEEVRA